MKQSVINEIIEVIGKKNFKTDGIEDYAIDGKIPYAVAYPENIEQISKFFTIANREKIAIIPRGTGTKISIGNIPKKIDIVLSTTKINQIIEYEPSELMITVQAGLKIKELQEKLGEFNQILPIDSQDSESTIGGIVASNIYGPRFLMYGSTRDMMLGIKIVNSDGKITKAGGKTFKNVAGYELGRLYTGSMGTLGIIVEATFKIYPLPEEIETVIANVKYLYQATEILDSIIHSVLLPSRLMIFETTTFKILDQTALYSNIDSGFVLLVSFEGSKENVTRQISDTQNIFKKYEAQQSNIFENEYDEKLWKSLKNISVLKNDKKYSNVICRIQLRRSDIKEFYENIENTMRETGVKPHMIVDFGCAIIRIYFSLNESNQLIDAIRKILKIVSELQDASLVIEDASPIVKENINVWGDLNLDNNIMLKIKESFDPEGILNPGRFFVG
jgi:glycolate oxidase FAD binding subunit